MGKRERKELRKAEKKREKRERRALSKSAAASAPSVPTPPAPPVITQATMDELERRAEEQKASNLRKRQQEVRSMVASGKLTKDEADNFLKKEAAKPSDPDAALPSLLIGKSNLPVSRSQTWTGRDPYNSSNVEEVGAQPSSEKVKYLKVR
jgi:hypothetical protein